WDLGNLWMVDRLSGVLRCVQTWHRPGAEFPSFVRLSRETTFPAGVGLPGRVWGSKEPVWISNVVEDPHFPRLLAACREGLHAGVAFPVPGGADVLGVLE